MPYHHVSLDPPALVLGVMGLAAGVFAATLTPFSPLWLTATAAYWTAGAARVWVFGGGGGMQLSSAHVVATRRVAC
jgi:hypothetical protein